MIDLCQWRARIGSWNCCHCSQSRDCVCSSTSRTGPSNGTSSTPGKTPKLILSIFCLAILLFISGDVELNPGPTLTDKPTKDELVELLSSSKFTACTWEQFVCYLSNMTPDVITGIRGREKVEDTVQSAVAQHCLDINPDVTWRKVIDVLLDANEVIVARNVLDNRSDKSSSKNVYRTVKEVLRSHYSKLKESTETCLLEVASQLYSKNLINKEVRHSPTFEKIEIDFSAMVSLYKGDAIKMMEVCSFFIECLSTAGGPAQEEAMALARDWEKEVFKDHQVSFPLTKVVTEFIPKQVQLSSNDNLAIELRNLNKKYAKLITDIITYYASSRKYDAIVIARWVQSTFDETGLARDHVTVDEIFERMQPHHSFIDIDAINDLMEDYPIDDTVLQARFDKYSDDVNNFIDSVKLDDMVATIEAAIIGQSAKVDPKIILKLSGKWNDKTIGHLRKLMKYLFDEEAKCVIIKKFLQGSICIRFLVSSNRSVKSLILKSQAKLDFLHHLGIFQLIIDDQIIIDRDEDISFTFEESLLESIASIEGNLEYHRLSLFLIELKIKLNYQNTNGKNALMLTSEGGHIELFKSLLLNGADPFVQLPANKGYIGLNSLACTALSEHIYKSIGGEKIMPQDGTSVEDMLDMAIEERGICSSSYDSFVFIIKNNLKERFQLLENCLHALSSSFIDTATYILTSKSLVRDARQNFLFYIKEDATCETAHQLLQLLQPHYSCLNVNLLTIPCTITEPIKKQVEDYNANLKIFKDTISLLELAMITKGMQVQYSEDPVCYSKLIIKLNKPWCSRTITELNKAEIFYFQHIAFFLTLQGIYCGTSSLTCTYLLPRLYTDILVESALEQRFLLHKIGVFEVILNDIPIMNEEEDKSFTFEAALHEAYQNNNVKVLFFLFELNISLPLQSNNTELMIACMRGDFVMAQFLLDKNPNINTQNDDRQTALMYACANGHSQIVEVILSKHPDINIQDNKGWTALMVASRYGHHQVVELLLNKNPDINIKNNDGWNALIAASSNGHHQVVKLLLSKDTDINIQNSNGWTALIVASLYGHYQVVELLLSKDPNINIQSDDGRTALMYACANGHSQVAEVLLSNHPDINIQNNIGWTALISASRYGHNEIVQLLLSKDPNINIQNNTGWTALMVASNYGHCQVVELLLSKGPDVNIKNNDGWTALIAASSNGHHQVVELLLSKDPDINIQDNNGCTALIFASGNGHHHVVQLLLSKDPDINVQFEGFTALMFASRDGHHQVVKLLLSKDPDIDIKNYDGRTALMCASGKGHYQVIEHLLSKDPGINIQDYNGCTALMFASGNGHHQVVNLLLSKDPDINIQNNNGWTALIAACRFGHYQVVELLLSKDPDINIQNNDGWTALMMASGYGHYQVNTLLLSKNPDINIQNNDGFTALIYASGNGHLEVVQLLLSKDADTNIQNNDGWTALLSSSYFGHQQIVELLLNKDPDIKSYNNEGITALMIASANGQHKVVQLFLSKDPNINIQSNDGYTALMLSCYFGHHQIVELLLSKDPDINAQANNGLTALILASGTGQYKVVELLISKNPDMNVQDNDGFTALMTTSYSGHYQVVELLLSKDPNINIQNNDGETALISASGNGHHKVVELLLSKDSDINIQNKNGLTALMAASGYGHHQIVELLLSKDPDICIQDNNGLSALTYALVCSSTYILKFGMLDFDQYIRVHNSMQSGSYAKIIKLLLDSHPNHNHTNSNLKPLHSLDIAALFNNFAVMKILMEKCDITSENIINAFTWACYGGHSSMIVYMSENINLSCNGKKLLVAAAIGDLDTLISMVNEVGMSPNTPLVSGITPLMIAASCGHIELVKTLMQTGADVKKTNDKGENALDIVNEIVLYDRSDVKLLLIANTPAVESDSSKKNMQPSIKSLLAIFKSFLKKAYNSYYAKQQEMKALSGVSGLGKPNLTMTSNMADLATLFVS